MKVIGGHARGRRLKAPKGQSVRPTSARVKEALFNILPHELSGVKILDLFAGSGNVTIEALSRGAAEAVLVDAAADSGKVIRENLQRLDLLDRTKIWIMPVTRAIRRLERQGETFDMIFLDPPYGHGLVETTAKLIARAGLLRDAGVLIAEHCVRDQVGVRYDSLVLEDQRRYGETLLSFFKLERKKL
jgi:16S rRNA (guanine966-N2)-methyltransferase